MPYSFIAEIKNVRKHSNADKLNVGECFGNQVIVSLETKDGDVGVYFPTDTQLGMEYADKNNLIRRKDENGNQVGGYLDEDKRNIRALKLRGEISDGLFMPLSSLSQFVDVKTLKVGDSVDLINGITIAQKYVPIKVHSQKQGVPNNKVKKFKGKVFPLFQEHIDTSQYSYNKHAFKEGDLVTISLKMHGTSGRTSNTLKREYIKQTTMNKLLVKFKLKRPYSESYDLVSGTRRTVLDSYDGGFYGSNKFREKYHDMFKDKLKRGESVYYEIVGYTDDSKPIMSECSNDKTQDKQFIKQYGKSTVFSYGCEVGQNDIYVYRMSITNEDGEVIEYPTWLVKQRCEEMGVKFVPVFEQFFFTTLEDLENKVSVYHDGVDPIGLSHVREGVVLRIENRAKFTAYKHKNFHFKCLEGIIKDAGIVDMEEQESLTE